MIRLGLVWLCKQPRSDRSPEREFGLIFQNQQALLQGGNTIRQCETAGRDPGRVRFAFLFNGVGAVAEVSWTAKRRRLRKKRPVGAALELTPSPMKIALGWTAAAGRTANRIRSPR